MNKFFATPFKTILARRMFFLFLVCAALPLMLLTFASMYYVRTYLETRISREMRITSRVYETVVFDELLMFEKQFKSKLSRYTDTGKLPETPVSDNPFLLEFGRLPASGKPPEPAMPSPWLELSAADISFLEKGQVMLQYTDSNPNAAASLRLLALRENTLYYGLASLDHLRRRIIEYGSWGNLQLLVMTQDRDIIANSRSMLPNFQTAKSQPGLFDFIGQIGDENMIGVVNTIFMRGRFNTPNWQMFLLIPEREALSPLAAFRYTLYLMMLIAVITACLVMIILIRRYTSQIEVLKEGTDRIRNHDFAHTITINSGDEFAQLGEAFNMMVHSLRDYRSGLKRQNRQLREKMVEIHQARKKEQMLQAQLTRAAQWESLGQLAGGVAHDFNNLLMATMGNIDLALLELPPDSPVRINLKHIDDATRRATELCRQMQIYSGHGTYSFNPIYPSELILEVGDLMRAAISKNIKLVYDIKKTTPAINGDSTQILQIILNFITNAAAAIGNNPGIITIRSGSQHCTAEQLQSTYLINDLPDGIYTFIQVIDNGCGIDKKTLDKIFEPFFTTRKTGHGLGLATVLGIIHAHQAAITVESKPGQGSTFTVFFPTIEPPIDSEPETSPDL